MNTYENRRKSLPKKIRENSRRMTETSMNSLFCHLKTPKNAMLSHWKTTMNNGIRSVCHVLTVCFPCILHVFCMYCVNGPVNTSKTSVFLVLTEPENYRIIERILEFTGKKTTEKVDFDRKTREHFRKMPHFRRLTEGF